MHTIPAILTGSVRRHADRPALQMHGRPEPDAYTYARLGRAASGAAARLAARGVGPGDPVALLGGNSPEWVVAYFALHLRGAVCVPLDPLLSPAEAGGILRVSGSGLLIASDALRDAAAAAAGENGPRVLSLEELASGANAAGASSAPDGEIAGEDDPAVIVFTSGTSGRAKGVVLTHRNIAANARAGAEWLGTTPEDRYLSILPLNHMFEQTAGLMIPIASGASIYYAGSRNPRTIVEAMRASRATLTTMVPGLVRLLHKRIASALTSGPAWRRAGFRAALGLCRTARAVGLRPERRLLRRIHEAFGGRMRFIVCGGAPLDAEPAAFFRDVGLPVLQGYGLSEAGPIVSVNRLGEHAMGSVGKPLPGVEVRVDAPPGADVGEVQVRGPNVMPGYFADDRATGEAFAADGWLRTGDLGRVDKRGFLWICGRLKDVIVGESGKNVYPEEIEAVLVLSPHLRGVCVLGYRPEDRPGAGEAPLVIVTPDPDDPPPGEGPPEPRLMAEVRRRCRPLAGYKQPRYFAAWPGELPRTHTLKLRKTAIRARLDELDIRPL